ncbi:MAG: LysR substrate-binding domain-containing protein [Pseudomonadota bacterium]
MSMHRGIKLRHIRAFLDTAEEGSVTGAARRMGISQPSLSKTLSELEAMMGVALLTRVGRGTALTAEGETFRRHALQAVQQLETGAAAVHPQRLTGTISVGLLPTVAGGFFPRVALDFCRRRPAARISVQTGPNLFLLGRLRAGEIDLMVGRMPSPDEMPGLTFDWLYDEEIVLAARPGHPLVGRPAEEAVPQCPLILPTPAAIIRRPVDDYLLALGVTDPQVSFETVSLAPGLSLVEGSDMLWFISRGVIARELEHGALTTLPIRAPFMAGAVGLTMKQSAQRRPEVAQLVDALHEAALTREGPRRAPTRSA